MRRFVVAANAFVLFNFYGLPLCITRLIQFVVYFFCIIINISIVGLSVGLCMIWDVLFHEHTISANDFVLDLYAHFITYRHSCICLTRLIQFILHLFVLCVNFWFVSIVGSPASVTGLGFSCN